MAWVASLMRDSSKMVMRNALKKSLLTFSLFAANLGAAQPWSQSLPDPEFVAKDVDEVSVSPEGRALAYLQVDSKGKRIGIYDVQADEAKPLLQLEKGLEVESLTWLAGGLKLLVCVRTQTEVSLHVLDAPGQTQSKLWSTHIPPKQRVDVHITRSPVLEHALVWIVTSPPPEISALPAEQRWVITTSAKSMVYHPDLDRACAEGYYFTGWSSTGSAILTNEVLARGFTGSLFRKSSEPQPETSPVPVQESAWTRDSSPFPQTMVPRPGNLVLECMPLTGALRQVRLKGAYQQTSKAPTIRLQALPQSVRYGSSDSNLRTLWMTSREKTEAAILLAPDAQRFWLAEAETGVAFLWNRMLFYRRFSAR